MNIFARELKKGIKSLLIWGGCAFLLIAGIMGKYSGLSVNDEQMNELLAKMPKAIQVFIGGGAFDLTQISGYVGVTIGYIMLIAAVFAVVLGANSIRGEERDKTAEFIMSKPVEKWRVLVVKLIASVCLIFLFTLTVGIALFGFAFALEPESGLNTEIVLMSVGLFLLQWIYLGLGAVLAALSSNPRHAGRAGIIFVFGGYFLSLLIILNEKLEFLRPLTPFAYFDMAEVIEGKGIGIIYPLISAVLGVIFAVAALIRAEKRDIIC